MRLITLGLGVIVLLAGLTTTVVFSQRRTFPETTGSIVFAMGGPDYSLYSMKPGGGGFGDDLAPLFTAIDRFDTPTVDEIDCSPDGRSLMLHRGGLYRLNIADKHLTTVLSENAYLQGLAWSPDGDQIALINVSAEGIFLLNADGTHASRLMSNQIRATSLAWSPDNTRLVFSTATETNRAAPYGISIVDIATQQMEPIYQAASRTGGVSWSPDGTRIAFDMTDGQRSDIYTIHPDGSNLTRLTYKARYNLVPRWSPDGSLISFRAGSDGDPTSLYVMNADGTEPYLVFFGPRGIGFIVNHCWLTHKG